LASVHCRQVEVLPVRVIRQALLPPSVGSPPCWATLTFVLSLSKMLTVIVPGEPIV